MAPRNDPRGFGTLVRELADGSAGLVRGEGAADGPGASAADQFSEDEATRVVSPDAGGDATWHAVVNGDQ